MWYGRNKEAKTQLESLINSGIDRKADRLLLSKVYYRLGMFREVEEISNKVKMPLL